MANTSSAKKAIRVAARKTVYNLRHKRAYKDARKDVMDAVAAKKKDEAIALLPKAYKEIDKASKTKVLHKNTAARYKSSLSKKVNSLA